MLTPASKKSSAGDIIVARLDIESSVAPTAATAILVVATEFGRTHGIGAGCTDLELGRELINPDW